MHQQKWMLLSPFSDHDQIDPLAVFACSLDKDNWLSIVDWRQWGYGMCVMINQDYREHVIDVNLSTRTYLWESIYIKIYWCRIHWPHWKKLIGMIWVTSITNCCNTPLLWTSRWLKTTNHQTGQESWLPLKSTLITWKQPGGIINGEFLFHWQ